MDILGNLLFWIHLIAVALGGVAVFGIPIIGARIAAAPEAARPSMAGLIEIFSNLGRGAFVTLIVTGPLTAWVKFGGFAGMNGWFFAKMAFVLILLGLVIWSGINRKRVMAGEAAALQLARTLGMATMAAYVLLILCAVLAFN